MSKLEQIIQIFSGMFADPDWFFDQRFEVATRVGIFKIIFNPETKWALLVKSEHRDNFAADPDTGTFLYPERLRVCAASQITYDMKNVPWVEDWRNGRDHKKEERITLKPFREAIERIRGELRAGRASAFCLYRNGPEEFLGRRVSLTLAGKDIAQRVIRFASEWRRDEFIPSEKISVGRGLRQKLGLFGVLRGTLSIPEGSENLVSHDFPQFVLAKQDAWTKALHENRDMFSGWWPVVVRVGEDVRGIGRSLAAAVKEVCATLYKRDAKGVEAILREYLGGKFSVTVMGLKPYGAMLGLFSKILALRSSPFVSMRAVVKYVDESARRRPLLDRDHSLSPYSLPADVLDGLRGFRAIGEGGLDIKANATHNREPLSREDLFAEFLALQFRREGQVSFIGGKSEFLPLDDIGSARAVLYEGTNGLRYVIDSQTCDMYVYFAPLSFKGAQQHFLPYDAGEYLRLGEVLRFSAPDAEKGIGHYFSGGFERISFADFRALMHERVEGGLDAVLLKPETPQPLPVPETAPVRGSRAGPNGTFVRATPTPISRLAA